jgi:GntR family transcriptional regulator
MLLNLTDLSSEPLHLQISRQIRAQILTGDLPTGESLPSIRVLARDNHVSVITVQRAYDDLDHEGLLIARRGKGFFVAGITEEIRRATALKRLHANLLALVKATLEEGLNEADILHVLNAILTDKSNSFRKTE